MIVVTDHACLGYETPGHPERPQRVGATVRHLQMQVEVDIVWDHPAPVDDAILLRAHTAAHLRRLWEPVDFDPDTAAHPDIAGHARRSVGGALRALDRVLEGGRAFSLMRPPGHHATANQAMGFCYLNQAAVTALEARERGVGTVAVFDFDVHHGNGTEDILRGREGIWFASVHEHPCYPGTGAESGGNIFNYPLPPRTPAGEYVAVLRRALERLLEQKPGLLVVSAGFDAAKTDPLAQQELGEKDFEEIGRMLRGSGVPCVSVLEGGYSTRLPDYILAYLLGIDGG
ncbi:MAG: hypothetical protein SFU85_01130 [Candidatus Methylacidiphilales bacterium]|nr:hypothetical protein [Candidatus Methylacidiphilales bacterium]